jgi:hypothetical protein
MRKTGLLAAGLALTLTLAGCGSKEAGIPGAATGGGDAGSMKLFGNALDLAGAVRDKSNAAQSAKLAIDMTAAGQSIKGDGAFRTGGDGAAMRMGMDMAGLGKMEMVLINKALYMKVPTEAGSSMGVSPDKPWLKISASGTDPLSKMLGPLLEQMGNSFDVSKTMDQIKTAGTITKSAKETLDGAETTHYWVSVDVAKSLQAQPGLSPELRKLAEDELAKSGTKTLEQQIWINKDNLPVQITMQLPAQGQTTNMTMKYLDWGQPVDIQEPPANQVGEFPR